MTGITTNSIELAVQGLRSWRARQVLVATFVAVGFGLLLGVVTVLIPNSFFARDIPPVWWNYPVWILTSLFSGMLAATYVRGWDIEAGADESIDGRSDAADRRTGRFGVAGGLLAWFAVGCPVCNKLALLALGYSGAITWFAPVQPFLAIGALMLTTVALVWRLRGQVSCPLPTTREKEMAR